MKKADGKEEAGVGGEREGGRNGVLTIVYNCTSHSLDNKALCWGVGLNLFIGVVPLGPNTSKSSISQHLYIGDLVSKTDFISPAGDCACKHMSDHIGAFVFKPPHALRHINSYRELTGFQGQF